MGSGFSAIGGLAFGPDGALYTSDFNGDRVWQIKPVVGIPSPAGLISWWRGEANAADETGAHPGTPVGNLAYAPGQVGQAFSLNGQAAAVAGGRSRLDIESTFPGVVLLSWPPGAMAYRLEAITDPAAGSWQTVTNAGVSDGSRNTVPLEKSGTARFFRLKSGNWRAEEARPSGNAAWPMSSRRVQRSQASSVITALISTSTPVGWGGFLGKCPHGLMAAEIARLLPPGRPRRS